MAVALFDLDGTLLDSWQAHADAARDALAREGVAAGPEDVRRFLIAHDAASARMDLRLYLRVWERMQPLYRARQHEVAPFPGAMETVRSLQREGTRVGIVTSKRRWAVERELRRCGLIGLFDAVVCREDTRRHKPSPEPLLLALERLEGEGAVYVGDAPTDVLAARAAGMASVGAGWGWCGAEALHEAGADAVCRAPTQLEEEIVRLAQRRSAS